MNSFIDDLYGGTFKFLVRFIFTIALTAVWVQIAIMFMGSNIPITLIGGFIIGFLMFWKKV